MTSYLELLRDVLENGVERSNRTGVPARAVFGRQVRHDLAGGFPLLTTKRLHVRSIVHELLWFLSGDTNIAYLKENKVRIWDEWADGDGELGPIYGRQWRAWTGADGKPHDQIAALVDGIREDPHSRRLVLSSWNVSDLPDMRLAPCHVLAQAWVADGRLSLQLYQRSADLFLGVPFNIASYALLAHMLAHVTGLEPGEYVHTFGDAHLYSNHVDQAKEQLVREPRPLPTLSLNDEVTDIFGFRYEDISFEGYDPHPAIKAPVAV